MIRATAITHSFLSPFASVTLDETDRHRRRMMMTTDRLANGSTVSFLLDLPSARQLKNGDGLVLEDGRIIAVKSKAEALYEIRAKDHRHLLSLAWQLGNRHLATQILEDRIIIRRDHVIKAMLEGIGASVTEITDAFDPEGGAYGGHHGAVHEH